MNSTTTRLFSAQDVRVFGDPQLHTDGDLLALGFAADGGLWSVEEPGVVRHWNGSGGQPLGWHSLSDLETLWCFSDDARVLASGSDDLSLWDAASGQLLTAIPQPSWVTALAFHRDSTQLATGHDDGVVRFWDAAGHQLLREFRRHSRPVSALAFSRDGRRLASAGEDKVIHLWEVDSGRHLGTLAGHTDRVPALAWHPQGKFLVSAGWDTTARVWDTDSCQPVILFNSHANLVTALAFSPDGDLLASADSAHDVHLWQFEEKRTLHVLKGHDGEVRCLAFSRDGRRLASGGADRVIHLWDPRHGTRLSGSAGAALSRTSLALGPGGTRLALSGGGTAPRVWDTASARPVVTLEVQEPVQALAYSPDGRWVAGGLERAVRLWDAADGRLRAVLDEQEEPVTALAFAPDGSALASASSTGLAVWLWEVPGGEPTLLIPDALDGCTVEALAFHPGGRLLAAGGIDWLATGGSDGAICVWDLAERCEIATISGGVTAVTWDPAGKRLASASLEQSVCVWDASGGELLHELFGHDGTVSAVAFSPDGRWLASGGEDRTVRLWDATTGEPVALKELDTQVKALCFAPDGRHLYTGNANTTSYRLGLSVLLKD
jgi:WD40 repeat protein